MLVAASDLGSFSRAADQMGISQPAFSEAIRKIELEVGCRLFDRTTRSLELTADGRHIVAIARELIRDFRIALENIRPGTNGKGPITIAALPSIAAAVIPSALKNFTDRFSDVNVAIHDLPQERALAMVLNGTAEIGIATGTAKPDGLHFSEVSSDPFVAVIGERHELRTKPQIRWKELAEFPFVALTGLSSIRRVTDAAFINADASPKLQCEVEQILSAVALVEAGYCVTALPSLACPMFRGRDVVIRPLAAPAVRRQIGILTLAKRKLSPAGLYMIEVLEQSIKSILLNST